MMLGCLTRPLLLRTGKKELTCTHTSHPDPLISSSQQIPLTSSSSNNKPTILRFYSLYGRNEHGMVGDDDFFSSDLTDEQMITKLGHMAQVRTLILWSSRDEYVPASVDGRRVAERIKQFTRGQVVYLEADHSVTDEGERARMVEAVAAFVTGQ